MSIEFTDRLKEIEECGMMDQKDYEWLIVRVRALEVALQEIINRFSEKSHPAVSIARKALDE